jgi:NADH-quinone oxidoreductase subunit G
MIALKDLMTALGSPHTDCRQDGAKLEAGPRASYLFNSSFLGIEDAGACLVIGANPRTEAPVLNARIRKCRQAGTLKVALVGPEVDLTYGYEHLGNDPAALEQIASGEHAFAKALQDSDKPMLILGMGALRRGDGGVILGLAHGIAESCGLIDLETGWNGFNVLHTAAARVGGMDLGFLPGEQGRDVAGILAGAESGDIEVVYLLGADEIPMERLGKGFVVYQGHHGDAGAHRADVILPGAAYTEKNATYVNTEGRVQRAARACDPPGNAREDWTILRALSKVLGQTLPMDTLQQARARLADANAVFATWNTVEPGAWGTFGQKGKPSTASFEPTFANFYMTNAICRSSPTMALCVEAFVNGGARKTGTYG